VSLVAGPIMQRIPNRTVYVDDGPISRIRGPETDPLADADFRRLFSGAAMNPARYRRLATLPRVEVLVHARVMGLATYGGHEGELRATDLTIAADSPVATLVIRQLLETIEMVAMAAGCRRVLLLPSCHLSPASFVRDGYRPIDEGCAGGWMEKAL
jgi:hypothetical protein